MKGRILQTWYQVPRYAMYWWRNPFGNAAPPCNQHPIAVISSSTHGAEAAFGRSNVVSRVACRGLQGPPCPASVTKRRFLAVSPGFPQICGGNPCSTRGA